MGKEILLRKAAKVLSLIILTRMAIWWAGNDMARELQWPLYDEIGEDRDLNDWVESGIAALEESLAKHAEFQAYLEVQDNA